MGDAQDLVKISSLDDALKWGDAWMHYAEQLESELAASDILLRQLLEDLRRKTTPF